MLQTYAYAVCFVTVICLMVAIFNVLYSALGVLLPRLSLHAYEAGKHASNETYWNGEKSKGEGRRVRPSEAVLTQEREASLEEALARCQQCTRQSLLQNTVFILVAGTLFFLHWRLAHAHSQVMSGSSWGKTASGW